MDKIYNNHNHNITLWTVYDDGMMVQTLTLSLFSFSSPTVLVPLTWTLRINNSSKKRNNNNDNNNNNNWNLENRIFTSMLKTRINRLLTLKRKKEKGLSLWAFKHAPPESSQPLRYREAPNSTQDSTGRFNSHFVLQGAYVRLSGRGRGREGSVSRTCRQWNVAKKNKKKTRHHDTATPTNDQLFE